jgi:hypothetical protein
MAIVDNQGRSSDINKELLRSLLQAKVQKVGASNPPKEADREPIVNKILRSFQSLGTDLSDELENAAKYFKSLSSFKKQPQNKKQENLNIKSATVWKRMGKNIETLTKAGTRKGSIHVHDTHVEKAIYKHLSKNNKVKTAGAATVSLGDIDLETKIDKQLSNIKRKAKGLSRGVLDTVRRTVVAALGGVDEMAWVLNGMVKDEVEFYRGMNAIAFQTQGITGDFKRMQRDFRVMDNIAKSTGQSLSTGQRVLQKLLVRGQKDRRQTEQTMKAGLALSTQIGTSAEETADLFFDWHMRLGLSGRTMQALGRDIRDVARLTGVTGANLLAAAKSSEQFLRNMAGAGGLTRQAAKSMITFAAEAKKLGVMEDTAQNFMNILSQPLGILELPDKLRAFVLSNIPPEYQHAAMMGQLGKSKEGMKAFAKTMDASLQSIVGVDAASIQAGVSFDGLQAQLFKTIRGIDALEAAKIVQSLRSASMSSVEVLADLDKELGKVNDRLNSTMLKESDRKLLLEEQGRLLDQQKETKFNLSKNLATEISKELDQGKGIQDALNNAIKQFSSDEIELMKREFQIDLDSPTEAMRSLLIAQAKRLKEMGGEDYLPELMRTIKDNDPAQFAEAQRVLANQLQAAETKRATDTDTLSGLIQRMLRANEFARSMFGGLLIRALDAVGPGGAIAVAIGSFAIDKVLTLAWRAKVLLLLGKIAGMGALQSLTGIKNFKWLKSLFRFGAGGAAATAAGSAAAGAAKAGAVGAGAAKAGAVGAAAAGVAKAGLGKSLLKFGLKAAVKATGIGAVLSAGFGVVEAFKSVKKAAEIFETDQENLSFSQKAAAGVAGFLTGTLDSLTFGLFDLTSYTAPLAKGINNAKEALTWMSPSAYENSVQLRLNKKALQNEEKARRGLIQAIEEQEKQGKDATLQRLRLERNDNRREIWATGEKLNRYLVEGDKTSPESVALQKRLQELRDRDRTITQQIRDLSPQQETADPAVAATQGPPAPVAEPAVAATQGPPAPVAEPAVAATQGPPAPVAEPAVVVQPPKSTTEPATTAAQKPATPVADPAVAAVTAIKPSSVDKKTIIETWRRAMGRGSSLGNLDPVSQTEFLHLLGLAAGMATRGSLDKDQAKVEWGKYYQQMIRAYMFDTPYSLKQPEIPEKKLGTNMITKSGLALLHSGESIIPAHFAEDVGPFILPKEIANLVSDVREAKAATAERPVSAQSKPLVDVYDRIREQQANTEALVSASATKEMSSIEKATGEQVKLLTLLHNDMQEVIELLTPSAPVGGSGHVSPSTASQNRVPSVRPDYGRWQYGMISGLSSKQVIYDGR